MADKGALEVVLGELTTALAPIVIAAEGQPQPDGLIRLALEIGVDLSMLSPAQGTAFATSVSGVYNDLTTLIENPDGFAEHIPEALDHIGSLATAIDGLDQILPQPADLTRKL